MIFWNGLRFHFPTHVCLFLNAGFLSHTVFDFVATCSNAVCSYISKMLFKKVVYFIALVSSVSDRGFFHDSGFIATCSVFVVMFSVKRIEKGWEHFTAKPSSFFSWSKIHFLNLEMSSFNEMLVIPPRKTLGPMREEFGETFSWDWDGTSRSKGSPKTVWNPLLRWKTKTQPNLSQQRAVQHCVETLSAAASENMVNRSFGWERRRR